MAQVVCLGNTRPEFKHQYQKVKKKKKKKKIRWCTFAIPGAQEGCSLRQAWGKKLAGFLSQQTSWAWQYTSVIPAIQDA
jgi:hypothetical protein